MQYLIQANGNEDAGTVCEISQKHPVIAGGWVGDLVGEIGSIQHSPTDASGIHG